MLSPRFIPKSLFYTQSVVRSPCFSTLTINWHKRCLFRRYARWRAFITRTRKIILFTNTTLDRLGSGGIFIFKTIKRRTLVHNTQPNYSFLFICKSVLYILREDMSARFSNAIKWKAYYRNRQTVFWRRSKQLPLARKENVLGHVAKRTWAHSFTLCWTSLLVKLWEQICLPSRDNYELAL